MTVITAHLNVPDIFAKNFQRISFVQPLVVLNGLCVTSDPKHWWKKQKQSAKNLWNNPNNVISHENPSAAHLWQRGSIFPPAEWRNLWCQPGRNGWWQLLDCLGLWLKEAHPSPPLNPFPGIYRKYSLLEEIMQVQVRISPIWEDFFQTQQSSSFYLPASIPLVTPGIPWISVTLLFAK